MQWQADDSSIISSPDPAFHTVYISTCCLMSFSLILSTPSYHLSLVSSPHPTSFSSSVQPSQPLQPTSCSFTQGLLLFSPHTPSPPNEPLHSSWKTGTTAPQEACVLDQVVFIQHYSYARICVRTCVLSLVYSVSQHEVWGGVTMRDRHQHFSPQLLLLALWTTDCLGCRHIPLLSLPFTSSSLASLILQDFPSTHIWPAYY